jgi:RNA polymerase sigma factor (sigma-70 family)
MRDDSTVLDIVRRARSGDPAAWSELVERYAPLVWAICRRYRLSRPDADDVGQNVWLGLLRWLSELQEPSALPGWLATTTRRECLRLLGNEQRGRTEIVPDSDSMDPQVADPSNESLPVEERNAILRAAFVQLSEACRRLLALLAQEPPLSYAEIGARLGVPTSELVPRRARCLEKLRRYPPLATLIAADAGVRNGGIP